MDRLDEVQAAAFESEYAVAVLGNRETGQFLLVELDKDGLTEAENLKARLGGLYFCGVRAYRHGECFAACEPDRDCVTVMAAAARAFAERVVDRRKAKDNGLAWLERLWSLPDDRPEAPRD